MSFRTCPGEKEKRRNLGAIYQSGKRKRENVTGMTFLDLFHSLWCSGILCRCWRWWWLCVKGEQMSPHQQRHRTTAHVLSWLIHNTPQSQKGFLVIIPIANIWAFWMFREMIQSSLIMKHNCVCWLPWLTAVQISRHPLPGILLTRLNYENH